MFLANCMNAILFCGDEDDSRTAEGSIYSCGTALVLSSVMLAGAGAKVTFMRGRSGSLSFFEGRSCRRTSRDSATASMTRSNQRCCSAVRGFEGFRIL